MPRQSDPPHSDATAAAIERVLKAEREGVEALRRSEDQRPAHARRRRGRRPLASPAAPTAALSRLHTAYLQKIEREVEALNDGSPGADGGDPAYGREALERRRRNASPRG